MIVLGVLLKSPQPEIRLLKTLALNYNPRLSLKLRKTLVKVTNFSIQKDVSVPEIAHYGPYYLPLNVFTASKRLFYFIFKVQ